MGVDPITAAAGGAMIGGALLGGGKKAKSPAADMQAQLAQMLFQQTDPVRRQLIDRSGEFLDGGMDVRQSPTYDALKLSADSNFNQAKDNVIARLAPGGGLVDALADLEFQRANTLTQGGANIYENELSRAMALGTGLTGTSMGALGQAGNVQAGLAAANAQQSAGKSEGLGQGVGYILGAK